MQLQHVQEIVLDLNTNTAYTTVGVKQADEHSRLLRVHITENGLDWKIPDGAIAQYRIRKPDGHAIWNGATIEGDNTVLVELTQQSLAASGRAYADIVFVQNSGNSRVILSTVSFILIIMAAPDITKQVVSTSEFGELIDLAESAEAIIYESEAWACGTRSGIPVVAEYFDYDIQSPGMIETDIKINPDIFCNFFGRSPGELRTYTFTCSDSNTIENNKNTGGKWTLMYDNVILYNITGIGTIFEQPLDSTNPEVPNLSSCGFTITPNGTLPAYGTKVTVTVVNKDLQYHNNSKYWADYSYTAKEAIENLETELTFLEEGEEPSVSTSNKNDISINVPENKFEVIIETEEDEETFINQIGEIAGEYEFIYDSRGRWELNGELIEPTRLLDESGHLYHILRGFGIKIKKTNSDLDLVLEENDSFTIYYNTHKILTFNLPRGRTGDVRFATFDINTDNDGDIPFGALCMYIPYVDNENKFPYIRPTLDEKPILSFQLNDGFLNFLLKTGGDN